MRNYFPLLASILLVCNTVSLAQNFIHQGFETHAAPGSQPGFLKKERDFHTWSKQHDLARTKGWKYYKRWEHEVQLHTDAQGQPVRPELYMEEVTKALKVKNQSNQLLSNDQWISEGPSQLPPSDNPTSQHGLGRINCMAFHPNNPMKYWVGVAQGGIWVTTDDGAT